MSVFRGSGSDFLNRGVYKGSHLAYILHSASAELLETNIVSITIVQDGLLFVQVFQPFLIFFWIS
jgi:hypothetical protein